MSRGLHTLAAAIGILVAVSAPAMAQQTQRPATPAVKAPGKAPPVASPLKHDIMKVRLVRSNRPGCEPGCPEWISAEGQIDHTSPAEFKRVLSRIGDRKLPVLIDSSGGSLDPSFTIARMIRTRGLDVVVTKTALSPCESTDKECLKLKAKGIDLGKPEAKISKCASSCAFVLAGGVRRFVGPWTVVGLHEIRAVHTMRLVRQHYRIERPMFAPARKQIVKQETLWSDRVEGPADEKVYERVKKFFAEMGVSEAIMPILRSAPNTSIRWVRSADLQSTGLATHFINGEQLLHPAPSVAGAPAAAAVARALEPSAAKSESAIEPKPAAAAASPTLQAAIPPSPAQTPAPAAPAEARPAAPAAEARTAAAQPQPPALPAPTSADQPAAASAAAEPAKPKASVKAKPKARSGNGDTSWRPF